MNRLLSFLMCIGTMLVAFSSLAYACSPLGSLKYTTPKVPIQMTSGRTFKCYEILLNPNFQTVLTLRNRSNQSDWDIAVGKSFDLKAYSFRGQTISHQNKDGSASELVILPAGLSGTYYAVVWPDNNSRNSFCLIHHRIDPGKIAADAFAIASVHWLLTQLFSGEDASQQAQRNACRVANLGISVLRGRDPGQVGFDVLTNEFSNELADIFGGGSWLFAFGTNYFAGFLEASAKYTLSSRSPC